MFMKLGGIQYKTIGCTKREKETLKKIAKKKARQHFACDLRNQIEAISPEPLTSYQKKRQECDEVVKELNEGIDEAMADFYSALAAVRNRLASLPAEMQEDIKRNHRVIFPYMS